MKWGRRGEKKEEGVVTILTDRVVEILKVCFSHHN